MKKLCVFIFAGIWLVLQSCSRCDNTTFNLSQDQRDFMSFKTGSYWIMRDSMTGQLDSFVITRWNNSYLNFPDSKKCPDSYEFIGSDLSILEPATGVPVDTLSYGFTVNATGYQTLAAGLPNGSIYNVIPFDLNFSNNAVLINGKTYNDVAVFSYDYIGHKNTIFLSKQSVLLKLVVDRDSTKFRVWEFIRGEIVR